MTLTEQEKIQRAEEIYYRRNGINYRTERPQTVREPKSHPIRNFLIIIMIIGVGFAYSNKDMLTSPEFQEKVKIFLNTKINIKDIFSLKQIKQENKTNDIKPAEQQSIQPTVEQLAENTGIENNEVIDNIEENKQEIITYEVIWPHKGEITSNFGERESTDSRVTGNHTGIDIAGNLGDKIISAINGKVLEVSEEGMLGKHMKIENENIITVYAHCNNIYVKEGEEIKQEQEIGEVGSTGNSTGNHLHFETILNGEYIDPMSVIENNNIFMKNENQPEDSKEGEV